MTSHSTSHPTAMPEIDSFLGEDWFDPLEAGVRARIRAFIEDLLEAELEAALGRERYQPAFPRWTAHSTAVRGKIAQLADSEKQHGAISGGRTA